jgi:hypothetical protein
MPNPDQERRVREARIEKIEADTRKERAKTEQRIGIDKNVEKENADGSARRRSALPSGSRSGG